MQAIAGRGVTFGSPSLFGSRGQLIDSTPLRPDYGTRELVAHPTSRLLEGSSTSNRYPNQVASCIRTAAARMRCLSLAKTCSIGFRLRHYGRSKSNLAVALRIALR